jgi:hypothetical protein
MDTPTQTPSDPAIISNKRKIQSLVACVAIAASISIDRETPTKRYAYESPFYLQYSLTWSISTFKSDFRISASSAQKLLEEIAALGRNDKLLPKKLLIALYVMSSGCLYRTAGDLFCVGKITVARAMKTIRKRIVALSREYIRFLNTDEMRVVSRKIMDWSGGLQGCVGAIDGSHVSFLAESSNKTYAANRKGGISTVFQAIVDPSLRFLDVYVGAYGSQHDARILKCSPFYLRQLQPQTRIIPKGHYIIGDDAYPLSPWLLTPFDTEETEHHEKFNKRFSRVRLCVERAFGLLKKQWIILVSRR